MHLYELNPIDIWTGWIKLEDALIDPYKYGITSYSPSELNSTDQDKAAKELLEQIDSIKQLLLAHTRWEGDGDVYLTSMPDEPESRLVFAIKQGHNGTTYIASPFEYPHIKDSLVYSSPVK